MTGDLERGGNHVITARQRRPGFVYHVREHGTQCRSERLPVEPPGWNPAPY